MSALMRPVRYIEPSLHAFGAATGPGAGGAIATLADPSNGHYLLEVEVGLGAGAVAAADVNNFEVRVGATVVKRIVLPAVVNQHTQVHLMVEATGTDTISVNATGAATGTANYYASITATRQ